MNWYLKIKLSSSEGLWDFLTNNPVVFVNKDKDGLPEGFHLMNVNNFWYVFGPKDYLLVDKERDKGTALRLAHLRIKLIAEAIAEEIAIAKPFKRSL